MNRIIKTINSTSRLLPNIILFFLSCMILLYFAKNIVLEFKFVFIFFGLLFLIYTFFLLKEVKIRYVKLVNIYIYCLINLIILFYSYIISPGIFHYVTSDILNLLVLCFLLYTLLIVINSVDKLKKFHELFKFTTLIFALVISFRIIVDALGIIPINDFFSGSISNDSVKEIDFNFALIPVFASIAILLFDKINIKLFLQNFYIHVFVFMFFLFSILFSGSRRGFLILIVFITVYVFFLILKKRNEYQNKYSFLVSILLFFSVSYAFFNSNYEFKEIFLKGIGSKDVKYTKENISNRLFKYTSLISYDKPVNVFYDKIWSVDSSRDPDSGWGTRRHKTVFPLTGKNVSIVPSGAKGYLLDSTTNCNCYLDHDFCDVFTVFANVSARNKDRFQASVFCYVSDDFDGDSVFLSVGLNAISLGYVTDNYFDNYSLSTKGIWKKLEINFTCNEGEIPIVFTFFKKGQNIKSLKGYVIFAYPKVIKIELLVKESNFLNIDLTNLNNSITLNTYSSEFVNKQETKLDSSSIYATDFLLNNHIKIEDRTTRWAYAIECFNQYNFKQKIFGGGFKFLNWYGYFFLGDKTKTDYPHNPILHILLYSGILGVVLYILLLYKVFYYYIKYIKEYYLFFIFFLITYFFTFFSGGNPFDPPIMGFFMMLPFFIHYIHEKDKIDFEKQGIILKIQGLLFKIRNFRSKN